MRQWLKITVELEPSCSKLTTLLVNELMRLYIFKCIVNKITSSFFSFFFLQNKH